jgi:deoxyribodipyrimidine photo-lyase
VPSSIKVNITPQLSKTLSELTIPIPAALPETHPISDTLLANTVRLFPAGEAEALKRLETFAKTKLSLYKDKRDLPGVEGTSCLSPYLSAGVISARVCLDTARVSNAGKMESGNEGAVTWISEVIEIVILYINLPYFSTL